MNEKTSITSRTKRGRKPVGDAPMTPAERQRRRRELLRTEGDKHYLLRLNGLQQEWIEAMASAGQVSGTKALQTIVELSLDRYMEVIHRSERLLEMGASADECETYIKDNFFPPLQDIDELELPRPGKN